MVVVGVNHHEARVINIQYGTVGWSAMFKNDKLWDKIKCQFLNVHSLKGLDEGFFRHKIIIKINLVLCIITSCITRKRTNSLVYLMLQINGQLLNIGKNMVFSVTGSQKLRHLHKVLH